MVSAECLYVQRHLPGVVNRARAAVACPIREEKGGGPVFTCWDRSNSEQGKRDTPYLYKHTPAKADDQPRFTCTAVATTLPNLTSLH